MSVETLESGYWRSYRKFYRWSSILRRAWTKESWADCLGHLAHTGAWKKAEPIWDLLICLKQVNQLLPTLERVLTSFDHHSNVLQR